VAPAQLDALVEPCVGSLVLADLAQHDGQVGGGHDGPASVVETLEQGESFLQERKGRRDVVFQQEQQPRLGVQRPGPRPPRYWLGG
jgi:hypothetical protein